MKILIRLEGVALMVLATIGFWYFIEGSWWVFAALFLTPDLGMLGYLINTKVGAVTYNINHHLMTPLIMGILGFVFHLYWFQFFSFVWVAHIGFDRMLGYGLKYPDAFKNTHLDKL